MNRVPRFIVCIGWLGWLGPCALGGLGAGCVDVAGGAVEVRWVLRNGEGRDIGCNDTAARLGSVQLVMSPGVGACANACASKAENPCRFSCDERVGTTTFFIPERDEGYAFSVRPVDLAGACLDEKDGVARPPPLLRQVRSGEVIELGVQLIIVNR